MFEAENAILMMTHFTGETLTVPLNLTLAFFFHAVFVTLVKPLALHLHKSFTKPPLGLGQKMDIPYMQLIIDEKTAMKSQYIPLKALL